MESITGFLDSLGFSTPIYLWIASALVLLLIFFPWARNKRGLAIDLDYWKSKIAFRSKRIWILSIPVVIATILMAGVLAGPYTTARSTSYIYGKPAMLVFDVSGSTLSLGPSYDSPKAGQVLDDLIASDSDANFGIMFFSSDNYIARYFTYKNELLKDTLGSIDEVWDISGGTRPTEALEKARQFLTENIQGEDKAIIFISDLDVDSHEISNIAEEMANMSSVGIRPYIIVLEGSIPSTVGPPQVPGVKVVDMNDKYGIDQICQEISAIQSSPIIEREILSSESAVPTLIPYLILPALGLIGLCLVLGETHFQKIP